MTKNKKNVLRLLGIVIIILIITKIDLVKVKEVLSKTNIVFVLYAFLLNVPQLWFKSTRWQCLLKNQNIKIGNFEAFSIYMRALFLGVVTPGRVGEISKAFFLKEKKIASVSESLSSVVLDRLLDLFLLSNLMALSFVVLKPFDNSLHIGYLFFAISIISVIMFILSKKMETFLSKTVNRLFRIKSDGLINHNTVNNIFSGLAKLVSFKIFPAVILTIASYLIYFGQCLLIFKSLGIDITYVKTLLIMAVVNMVSFLPVSFSAIGTRDAALLFLFRNSNVSVESVVAYSVLILFVFYLGGVVLGAWFWFKGSTSGSNTVEE